MKMLADENLFEPIIQYMRDMGHDLTGIRDSGLSGISDDEVYQLACKEKRTIITMDKDFERMVRFPPEWCEGIIVVKIYRRPVEETLHIFKKVYTTMRNKDIRKKLVIITPEGWRVKRKNKLSFPR
ncbi:MAG: DUF5615 family PIN-like protein [Deltaproteobacteria bacterium]|nr:DUF5615 family PIN-like protein [Deltaproteobacteria bacterium]